MAGLHFNITGDNSDFMNALRETETGIRNTAKGVEKSGMSIEAMFGKLSKAAAGLGVAFSAQQFISQMASVRGEFQQLEVAFETMLGSTEKASSLMAQITRTAAVTPFGLQDVAGGAKQLLAYGVAAEEVNDTLVRLGDIAAGLSIPLNDLVYLYGTTMTQGRMFTQDLRQFQGRGIPLADELAKQFGVTKDAVGDLVSAGKVGFKEMQQAIISMTSEGGKFGGLMEAQSKIITGQISNIEDAIDQMFNEIGKSSEGVINLTLSGVSAIVENYELVGKALMAVVTTYGAYRAAVIANIALTRSWAVAARADAAAKAIQTAATKAQTIATIALNTALKANPFVLVATGVVALGTAMWALSDGTTTAERSMKDFNEEQEKLNRQDDARKQTLKELVEVLQDENTAEGQRMTTLQLLNELYPEIRQQFVDEKGFIKDITGLWEAYEGQVKSARKETLTNAISVINESLSKVQQEIKTAKGGTNIAALRILEERERRLQADLKNNQQALNDLEKQNNTGDGGENKSTDKNKEYWENKKKEAEKARNALDVQKVNSADWKKYTAQIIEAENQLAKYKSPSKDNKEAEQKAKQQKKVAEELLSMRRKTAQDEINLLEDSGEKRRRQIEHNYQLEIDEIEKQRQAWKEAQGGTLSDEQHAEIGRRYVAAEDTRNSGLAKITKEEVDAAEQSMNEYLAQYGDYMQKRKAITDMYTEKMAKATTKGEKLMLAEQMKRELAAVDDEVQGQTNSIAKLFQDMSEKSVASMREIADEAELALAYLDTGKWEEVGSTGKDAFGFTKEQYDLLRNNVQALNDAREGIKNIKKEADNLEPTLKKMSKDFKDIFSGNYGEGKFEEKLGDILSGVGEITKSAEFLGESLSMLSEAFGGNFLGGLAEGIGVATEAANAAMSGAQAGKVFGPWGAAAGAAIGAVTSLASSFAKLHDKKHEKRIQKIQEQVEALEKSYDSLGDKIEKAFSNDASNLIKDQNKLLEQQKVLIQNQIKEEEAKKKTDDERIKEWQAQLDEIDKTIEDNKTAAIDAIFGSDIKSAIEDFASAYAEVFETGKDRAESAKDFVKSMIRSMVSEAIKAASSEPIGKLREKLLEFWGDSYISAAEQEYLNKMAEELQEKLDRQFGWADEIFGESEGKEEFEENLKNFSDSVKSVLYDAESTAKDVAENIYDFMRKAFIDSSFASQLEPMVNKWFELYKGFNADNLIGNDERKELDLLLDEIAKAGEEINKTAYKMFPSLDIGMDEKIDEDTQKWESFSDNILSSLTKIGATSEDISKNMGETMRESLIKAMYVKNYEPQMKKWYKAWQKAMGDGDLSADEKASLDLMKQSIINDAMKEVNAINKLFESAETTSQQATSKGFSAMSQETGQELNGRFTALQIAGESVKNSMLQTFEMFSQVLSLSSQSNSILSDILAQHAISNNYLSDIAKYAKVTTLYGDKLDKLIEQTKNI